MPIDPAELPRLALVAALVALTFALLALSGRLRALREEFPDRWRGALGLLLLACILAEVVFGPTAAPGEAADVDPGTIWFPSLFAGHLLLAIFLLCWWMLGRPMPLRRFLRLEGATSDLVPFGLSVGAGGWVLAIIASAITTSALYLSGWHPAGNATALDGPDVPPLILWLTDLSPARKLIVVLVAMTVEEAFYRAYLQPRIGWIPSSLCFALSHAGYGIPNLLASVFAVSLAIGWAFRRTGNLLPCIVAHGFFDGMQLFLIMPMAIEALRQLSR